MMVDAAKIMSDYSDLIDEHRAWLELFGKLRLKKWEDFLKSNSEGAICEAATRRLLCDHSVKVIPNEDISGGGPDFLCVKNSKSFYVEVTSVSINKLTDKCGMSSDEPKAGSISFLLTSVLLGEIRNKTPQCSNLNSPCILVIGTLHFNAGCRYFGKLAAEALLTSTPQLATNWNSKTGCAVGDPCQIVSLRDSAFIRFTKRADGTIECARNPISAVLLCAFGQHPIRVYGLLHPNPNYPFDRALLPKIKFCRLAEGYRDGPTVEWI
jgi:hypothetical protein